MNYLLTLSTIILLAFLVFYQWKVWHFRIFISPALYFCLFWLFGPFYLLIFYNNLSYDPYPEYINELNILISFTVLSFIFWTKKGRNKIHKSSIYLPNLRSHLFNFLSIFLFLVTIYEFVRSGANFNMGLARDTVHETLESQSFIVGYSKTLAYPLSLYAGYKLAINLITLRKAGSLFLFVPLLSNLIISINVGGRVDLMYSIINYSMGSIFALPIRPIFKTYKYFVPYILSGFLLFFAFVNVVSTQRSIYKLGSKDPIELYLENHYPLLSFLYSPMSYVKSSYTGYQLRRVDAVDEKVLGWGKYTFNGFINWTIPFSGVVGLKNFSIAKELDIYYNAQETYDYERELYHNTHSAYLTIIKDYGFWGAFLCIFILTGISHYFFIKIQIKSTIYYFTSFYLFYIFWNYWTRSVFYSTLSFSLLVPLYGFLIIDLINNFGKNPFNNTKI